MSRDTRLYLEDIQTSCKKILRYIKGMEYTKFVKDDRTYDAVIRNLEIIGEAANKVPDNFQKQHSSIEWRQISALRNVVAHQYFGIQDEIIWDIIQNKIPPLLENISLILK
jgi:uncharacterized protein with HEPN domain